MKHRHEITDYDTTETTTLIDRQRRLKLQDLGFKLPPTAPSQVVSIRLPTRLLNVIRARASALDVPYQAFIKLALSKAVGHRGS